MHPVLGTAAALTMLFLGFLLLPPPGIKTIPGLFSSLWLALCLLTAFAFARDWRRRRLLLRLRRNWRGRRNISLPRRQQNLRPLFWELKDLRERRLD